MSEHLNIKSFKLLNEVVFRHCTYMHKSAVITDKNDQASIPYLEQLLNAGSAEFYTVLLETFASVKNGQAVSNIKEYPRTSVFDVVQYWKEKK